MRKHGNQDDAAESIQHCFINMHMWVCTHSMCGARAEYGLSFDPNKDSIVKCAVVICSHRAVLDVQPVFSLCPSHYPLTNLTFWPLTLHFCCCLCVRSHSRPDPVHLSLFCSARTAQPFQNQTWAPSANVTTRLLHPSSVKTGIVRDRESSCPRTSCRAPLRYRPSRDARDCLCQSRNEESKSCLRRPVGQCPRRKRTPPAQGRSPRA